MAVETAETVILSGNEAVARGAWEAGVTFGSGYPGTPSSEILPALTQLGDCYTEWSVNEKCAMEAAAGASLAGARCLVTMKHVGLNVAADPFFTMSYTGVNGGLVIANADDPDMHSSQNEQDNRHYARAAQVPMLEPCDSQEAKELTKQGFEISERFDTPVVLRTMTRIAHSEGVVNIADRPDVKAPAGPEKDPRKYVMVPANARKRRVAVAERTEKLKEFAETTDLNRIYDGSDDIGIITSSVAYEYARQAAPEASFLKLGLVWPLPKGKIREFADNVDRLFVVEELGPYLTEQIQAFGVEVEPWPDSLYLGELTPERVAAGLDGDDIGEATDEQQLPPRPPAMCPGCPHRGVFIALRNPDTFVTGDIGCYTLGTLPPLGALHTCLCMGAGVGQTHGIEKAAPEFKNKVAVIGDSTFVHSGITGVVNIAYNNGSSVVVILDNDTTAMTGGQSHPATGESLSGGPARKLDLAGICKAAGIPNVRVIDPYDLEETESTLREAIDSDEPWAVIARRPCVLKISPPGGTCEIDTEACIQCGRCVDIGCPAISIDAESDGEQPIIDPVLCVNCDVCAQVCPVDAIAGE